MTNPNSNEGGAPPEGEAAKPAGQQGEPEGAKPETGPTDWKAEARKWEQRAKANLTAAEELEQIKESQKSEAQKQAERIAALEEEVNASKATALRAQFSADVPESLRPLITGSTEAELKAQRDSILGYVSEQQNNGNVVPREGTTPPSAGSGDDMAFANFLTGHG